MDLFFLFFFGGGGWGGEGHYEIGLFLRGVISIHFRDFKVKIQNGNIFSAAKFQIFLGMPEGPSLCMKKN